MRTREQLEGVFVIGLCGFLLTLFVWAGLFAFGVVSWLSWTAAFGIGALAFGAPFGLLAFGKTRVVLSALEGELYRSTGLAIDLDGDRRTGQAELLDDDSLNHKEIANAMRTLREAPREIIRVIPVRTGNHSDDLPVLQLPDGRELDAAKLRDFVVEAQVVGIGLKSWRAKGWTRKEWEIARDLLSLHGLASKRAEGVTGVLTASPGQCLRAFGL